MYRKVHHRSNPEVAEDLHYRPRNGIWSRMREKLLTRKISDTVEKALSSRQSQFSDIKVILAWYRSVAQVQQSNLLRDTLWLNTNNGSSCRFGEDETVSHCFEKVLQELDSTSSSGLRICALSATTNGTEKLYSFLYDAYLTLSGRIGDASRLFHLLTARLLIVYWAANPFEEQVIELLISEPAPISPQWQPELPSGNASLRTRPLTARDALQRPLEVNPATWDNIVYLEWQWLSEVPQYVNDVDIYIWEPFKQRPTRDYVRLAVLEQTRSTERKVVLIASSSRLLARLAIQPVKPDRRLAPMPGVDSQIFRLVVNIHHIFRSDVTNFLKEASARVESINMRSRSNPSGWKVQLLLHLQECYRHTALQCDETVQTLGMLASCMRLPCAREDFALYEYIKELQDCRVDLQYLAALLREKGDAITPVKEMVREQMDLVQSYRNAVIAVLVALYVPISFVSSFLGMNITDRSSGNYWREMHVNTSSTGSLLSPDTLAGNYTINTDNYGTRTWPLRSFWASAFPLAFGTIVIPIVAGPAFRWMAQFARRHRVWWRAIVMTVTAGVVLCINIVNVTGDAVMQRLEHGEDSDTLDEAWRILLLVSILLGCISLVVHWTISLWHLWVATRLRLPWLMTLVWSLVFGLSFGNLVYVPSLNPFIGHSIFTSAAVYYAASIILPLLPWIALFLMWTMRPDYFLTVGQYRRQRRQRRTSPDTQPVKVK